MVLVWNEYLDLLFVKKNNTRWLREAHETRQQIDVISGYLYEPDKKNGKRQFKTEIKYFKDLNTFVFWVFM